jgi:hypothetical protein
VSVPQTGPIVGLYLADISPSLNLFISAQLILVHYVEKNYNVDYCSCQWILDTQLCFERPNELLRNFHAVADNEFQIQGKPEFGPAQGRILKRTRVLVANRPRLMRELVLAVVADQPDIEVVGEVNEESQLVEAVEATRPDVVILALDDDEKRTSRCGFLLGRYPHMKILSLAPEQNRGLFYWAFVDVRSRPLESSEAGILNALRQESSVVGMLQS